MSRTWIIALSLVAALIAGGVVIAQTAITPPVAGGSITVVGNPQPTHHAKCINFKTVLANNGTVVVFRAFEDGEVEYSTQQPGGHSTAWKAVGH